MKDQKLNLILKDNISGSTELLQKLIGYFLQNTNNISDKILVELKDYFKSFQTITEFLSELQLFIHEKDRVKIVKYLKLYSDNTTKELNLTFQNALPYLDKKKKFVTISNSKTLQFVFSNYQNLSPDLEITVLESRPQFEGRILAKELSENNIKVSIITEGMAANSVEECDAVIIGADKILSNGSVINKTGSRNLAILSKFFNKPFYVLTSKIKFSNFDKYERDLHNPHEIWSSQPNKIKIRNYYFEKIEADLITKIITD